MRTARRRMAARGEAGMAEQGIPRLAKARYGRRSTARRRMAREASRGMARQEWLGCAWQG